jgi:hypothetical protein
MQFDQLTRREFMSLIGGAAARGACAAVEYANGRFCLSRSGQSSGSGGTIGAERRPDFAA